MPQRITPPDLFARRGRTLAESRPAINHDVDFALGPDRLAVVGLVVFRSEEWDLRPEARDPLWQLVESADGRTVAAVRLSLYPLAPDPAIA